VNRPARFFDLDATLVRIHVDDPRRVISDLVWIAPDGPGD